MAQDSAQGEQFEQLVEVVQYAIQKEQEAVDFYTDLAGKVKTESLAEEIRKIAAMEVRHREWLERMDVEAASARAPRDMTDLGIADYLVEKEPSSNVSWQDILTIAMHRELAAMKLYSRLSQIWMDPAISRLFANLAAEEAAHKQFFEKIWDEEILLEG